MPRLLRQSALIIQIYIIQNNNILYLLKDFRQIDNKGDKQSNFLISEIYFPRLLLNIMPVDDFAVSTRIISDIKQWQAKTSTVGIYKKDMKQITLLRKLKYKSLTLKGSIQDNLDLMLVNKLLTNLSSY